MRRPLAAALAAVLTACGDDGPPTAPDVGTRPIHPRPELSVVQFGITQIAGSGPIGAVAINDLGQIAGTRFGSGPAFIWTSGSLADLPLGPGQSANDPIDLNASGTAVGFVYGDETAAVWQDGSVTQLNGITTGATRAWGINDRGEIVGSQTILGLPLYWTSKDDPVPAVLQTLGGIAGPRGINNAGVIVGTGTDAVGSIFHAVVWETPSAEAVILKSFDGTPCRGTATDVNELGAIAGQCDERAAYWTNRLALPVRLPSPIDASSQALALNDLGQLVGSTPGPGGSVPALWMREGSGFRRFDLGGLAPEQVGEATGINNTGQAAGTTGDQGDGAGGGVPQGVVWTIAIQATLDLVPGDASNQLRLGRRVSAAILGSPWFQAAKVDPASLTLGNDDGQDTSIDQNRKLVPAATLVDANRDGYLDLVADFDGQRMAANGDLALGTQTPVLLGRLKDGNHIRGTDVVQVTR
jgi:uncharacterized membrane protein